MRILLALRAASLLLMLAAVQHLAYGQLRPSNDGATGSANGRSPRTLAEFDEMFKQISNWGRWGKDDELGAANLVTLAKRKQALALAKEGTTVSLAHNPLTEPALDNRYPFEHTMSPDFKNVLMDTYKVFYHGWAHSHVDALCHFPYKGQMYNGFQQSEVNTPKGCSKLGIQNLKDGVLTRGILIDIPRLRGVQYLEPGTPIYAEDLEAWEKSARLKISPGDAIFLRTGRWARRSEVGPWQVSRSEAGLHASVAPWMKARGVAFVGSDSALDVLPSLVDGIREPTHILLMTALGIHVLDNQDLEVVAETAAKLGRWEFMVTFAPLPVTGGTGFPINATAVF